VHVRTLGAAALGLSASLVPVLAGCAPGESSACGPTTARVVAVTDGDTVTLDNGEKVRYLLVHTNEITNGKNDCFGQEARQLNESLVLDQTVTLRYEEACRDRFGRLLAYVTIGGREVNRLLVERGYACVLYIPPNGTERRAELEALEDVARDEGRGMWGFCAPGDIACDD
jgi:micrococcal nuclease